jgi:trehalose utilization protein
MNPKGIDKTDKIKVAVVFQGHPFDVPGFRDMFDRMPDVDYYLQDYENWAVDAGKVWSEYDVHLFYDMHYWGRFATRGPRAEARVKETIGRLGETEQGILVLHHALLSFTDIDSFNALCNSGNRRLKGCTAGETVETLIANPNHPITRGLQPWTMTDEVYILDEPQAGSDVLLTTNNPKSTKALGWVHQYRQSRVFCYESGHDNEVYTNPSYQVVLHRGIQWLARKI